MENPKNLKYTATHEWLSVDGNVATVGITDFAQEELSTIVYVNLGEVGNEVEIGDQICEIESSKAFSEAFSPVKGKIIEVNNEVIDNPELINNDAFSAWLVKIEFSEMGNVMSAEDYEKTL